MLNSFLFSKKIWSITLDLIGKYIVISSLTQTSATTQKNMDYILHQSIHNITKTRQNHVHIYGAYIIVWGLTHCGHMALDTFVKFGLVNGFFTS